MYSTGIQFRRMAGEVFYQQATALTGDEVARDFAAVRRKTIPDNQHLIPARVACASAGAVSFTLLRRL
jgi:hypothetical protein